MENPVKNTYSGYKDEMKIIINKLNNLEKGTNEYNELKDELEKVENDFKKDWNTANKALEKNGLNLQNMIQNQVMLDEMERSYLDFKNDINQPFKKQNSPLELANKRALEDNHGVTDIYSKSVNIENGTVIDSIDNIIRRENMVPSLFLNKTDKLADRVNVSDEKTKELLNQDGALGEVIKGMVTGKWSNQEFKNVVTTTSTGVLIPEVLSANIIDLARNISLFTNAGVPVVPMDSNNMTISRIKTDPTFGFKAEGTEGVEGSFELDSVELKSKTVYGYAYVSLESINSSKNLDQIIRQVFAQAMANTIDKAFIYGQENAEKTGFETFAPGGIMNDININSVVATTGGGYDDIIKAISKVRQSNGNPTAYGINAETEELLSLLKTTDGQYLSAPKAVTDLKQIVSNQLKYDEATGSDALVFDPRAMIIGLQNNIQIKIIEDAECLKKGLIAFQIYSMLDCKATTPKHICKITGIK